MHVPRGAGNVTRSRASAKAAGAKFERTIADYLAMRVDDRIDKRPRTGAKDKGDIGGWRFAGRRIVVDCKDWNRLDLAGWIEEAEVERGNDDADVGLVIHKRRGKGWPGDQYVTLTLDQLLTLLGT
jgi:hypothetical protein